MEKAMTDEKNNRRLFNRFALRGIGGLIGLVVVVILAFFLGGLFFGGGQPVTDSHDHSQADKVDEPAIWTCSMHPQIKLPKAGKCPICFMDLIPLDTGSDDETGPRQLRLSETAKQLARIETTPAVRAFAEAEVRMVGRIAYDETRLSYITAWVPGRLDRLYADFTGISVRRGDHMVQMYSPELLAAQEELFQAARVARALKETSSTVLRSTADATVVAVREKLRLYGLSVSQIETIESSGEASEHLTINAPIGGVVVHKNAQEGMYVKTGTRIYTIADLTRLWITFEAYESDLPWIRYGQYVTFTTLSFPGETFRAQVSFIDPMVDPGKRTIGVRAIVENKDLKLKPDMFVRGVLKSRIDDEGKVIDYDLAGKWISPMHPEVVKDGPGQCDVCGMDLVPAESLGYSEKKLSDENAPLLIPTTAPMVTGRRAIVYVEVPNDEGPLFEGREVELGPRAGNFYVVKSGIHEGEMVVTNGAFKLDSELQIRARPSMMSPEGGALAPGHQHGTTSSDTPSHSQPDKPAGTETENMEARHALTPVYTAYFEVQMALAGDNLEAAGTAAGDVGDKIAQVDMSLFSRDGHNTWMELSKKLSEQAATIAGSDDIEAARKGFYNLSNTIIELHDVFGHADDRDYFLTFCPMANNNKGALWLQTVDTVYNSFYGASMLRCGEIKKGLPAEKPELPAKSTSDIGHLTPVYHAYFKLQRALTFDHLRNILDAYRELNDATTQVDLSMQVDLSLTDDTLEGTSKEISELGQFAAEGVLAQDVSAARTLFLPVANGIISLHNRFGHVENRNYYLISCPHATDDGGAHWIQDVDTMYNSFLGGVMAECPKEKTLLPPLGKESE
jgi:Cu(I)/Ag(I) efflux system membrane fusion protein